LPPDKFRGLTIRKCVSGLCCSLCPFGSLQRSPDPLFGFKGLRRGEGGLENEEGKARKEKRGGRGGKVGRRERKGRG